MNIFHEYPVIIPLLTAVLVEVGKLIPMFLKHEHLSWKDLTRTGGLPSGHSAIVASLVYIIYFFHGPKSSEFAIAVVFAFLVLYDAMKLRRAAGLHAAALNVLTKDNKFDERLGHTPLEVLVGIATGTIVAALLLSF